MGPILFYKNLGETPLEAIERFRLINPLYKNVPMTYAGRLDPAATGLLVLLGGDLCTEKDLYTSLPEPYEGSMLFGFNTDFMAIAQCFLHRRKRQVQLFGKFFQRHDLGLIGIPKVGKIWVIYWVAPTTLSQINPGQNAGSRPFFSKFTAVGTVKNLKSSASHG